jgi:type I restriction enzyme R subunit
VSFEKILEAVSFGNREPELLSSLASRLARLDLQLTDDDRKLVRDTAGQPLAAITKGLVEALDPDLQADAARAATGVAEPSADQVMQAAAKLSRMQPS